MGTHGCCKFPARNQSVVVLDIEGHCTRGVSQTGFRRLSRGASAGDLRVRSCRQRRSPSAASGRVEMWRGGSRSGLSVAAPFVWRCPNNLAVAPFPHPAHRTGRADLPHPALGQDACFRPRKVALCLTEQQQGPCGPCCISHGRAVPTADATTWADIRSPDQGPSPSFASACDACGGSRALAEFARVAPISSTSPLSTSALN